MGGESLPGAKRRRITSKQRPPAGYAHLESSTLPGSSSSSFCTNGHASNSNVRVHVFWGTTCWSRCQLVGEVASGSCGLCRSKTADVTEVKPDELYASTSPRLIFAPKSQMTEED